MRWTLVCFCTVAFILPSMSLAQTQKMTPTQKNVPAVTQKTATPVQKYSEPVQKTAASGMWVYIDAATLAEVRELQLRQSRDCLIGTAARTVVINCLKKKLGDKLADLIPSGPNLPIDPPGGPGLLGRLRSRRNTVEVQTPTTYVNVAPPQYYAEQVASDLAPPPDPR